ncbi:MAG TPA: hypothetical protein VHV82_15540 [Sporichthyaceae bacterium]|jgi:hypothetical protein|nr:hypothetical protein [Sporichthyaceae bacterium]
MGEVLLALAVDVLAAVLGAVALEALRRAVRAVGTGQTRPC